MSTDQYIRLEEPGQVQPGDSVFQVVQYGTDHEKHVKHNEWRVLDVGRKAVTAMRQGGPKGGVTKTLRFEDLVIKAPELPQPPPPRQVQAELVRAGVVKRKQNGSGDGHSLAVIDTTGTEVKKKQDDLTAYLELSQSFMQKLRLQLEDIDDTKDDLVRELGDKELEYRQVLEKLNEQIRSANYEHQKERQRLQASIDAMEKKREPLCDQIEGIEALLVSMGAEV